MLFIHNEMLETLNEGYLIVKTWLNNQFSWFFIWT